jgi:UDP-N-acetylglucosamine:LPS N-acetylglucosamine transferase
LGTHYKVLLVRGIIEAEQRENRNNNILMVNYMETVALEKAINESNLVVSRSGYTTIMDLAVLKKQAFLIPTPGQYEQVYLAKWLKEKELVTSCKQQDFTIDKLDEISDYQGFLGTYHPLTGKDLFGLFEGK